MKVKLRGMRVLCIFIGMLLAFQTAAALIGFNSMKAYALTDGPFTFRIIAADAAEITGYTGAGGAVTIPTEVTTEDGGIYTVVAVGDSAFINCSSLTSIIIPDHVTAVRQNAFYNCSSLTSIIIPDSMVTIGRFAFNNCRRLTSINIPSFVSIIGSGAFSGCSSLTSISIPSGVKTIDNSTFAGCSSLTSITIAGENTEYSSVDGILFNYDKSKLILCPEGKLGAVTIPNSVNTIGRGAFNDCRRLTSIAIPDSVTTIENEAFRGCISLTSIAIPSTVTAIGDYTFMDCSSLTSIPIPNSVTRIGNYMFSRCTSLTNIIIPDNVTTIGGWAFSGCSGLTSISIPNSVTTIADHTFYGCPSLASIAIPDSVTSIGDGAFMGCLGLTSIAIPDSVTVIGEGTFNGCSGLTRITLPNSVTSIGATALSGCRSLINITIPPSVTSIGDGAFSGCSNLTSITIPNSVTGIGSYAFQSCEHLELACFLGNAPWLGVSAFDRCADQFKVYYISENTGFTNPWYGYPTDTFILDGLYEVTFNSQGGSYVEPTSTNFNTTIIAPPSPTKSGYTFGGWYKDDSCTNVWSFASDTVRAVTTLYARWTPNTYTIKFSGNGSTSGTMASIAMTYDVSKALSTNAFKKTGYAFLGWATSATGSVVYKDLTSVKNLTATNGAAITLYAKWAAPITSATSYNYNGIKVSWAYAGSATSYKIYRATSATGTYSLVYTASSTARSWVNTSLVTGKTYYYKVYPVAGGKTYAHSTYKYAKAIPTMPTVTISKASTTSIKVTWTGVVGATKYQVYRATSATGTYTLVYTASSTLRSWTNTGLTVGRTYYYKVRAYHLEGSTNIYGSFSGVKCLEL